MSGRDDIDSPDPQQDEEILGEVSLVYRMLEEGEWVQKTIDEFRPKWQLWKAWMPVDDWCTHVVKRGDRNRYRRPIWITEDEDNT